MSKSCFPEKYRNLVYEIFIISSFRNFFHQINPGLTYYEPKALFRMNNLEVNYKFKLNDSEKLYVISRILVFMCI